MNGSIKMADSEIDYISSIFAPAPVPIVNETEFTLAPKGMSHAQLLR